MANSDAFQANGAIQLAVRPTAGPQLGKYSGVAQGGPIPVNGTPVTPQQGGGTPMRQVAVGGSPIQMQQPISSPQAPKGAQPVALVGQPSPFGQQSMPLAPAPRPQMAGPQGQPYLHKAASQPAGGGEVHTISVVGLGADGKKYLAEFDAVFPPGTKIEEVSERVG